MIDSPYCRGGVTGVGVITALAGLAELGGVLVGRDRRRTSAPDAGSQEHPAG